MTREEAIQYLQKLYMMADITDEYGYMDDTEPYETAVDMAIKALEEQQWVPCSERFPRDVEVGEEYPTVIFCTKDAVYVGFYEHYLDGRWWTIGDYTVDNVIAWMPMPPPWEGE